MTEHNEHINQYSAADIEKYYSGKMSAQEMHQLEKAALDDPFLSDALEGYQYTARPAEDSKDLHKTLLSRLEGAKVITLQKREKRSQLWKIAAMFVLIGGTAWFVYRFALHNNKNEMAVATGNTKQKSGTTDDSSVALSLPAGTKSSAPSATSATVSAEEKVETKSVSKKQNNNSKAVESNEIVATAPVPDKLSGIATETADEANALTKEDVAVSNRQAAPTTNEADSTVIVGYGTQRKMNANNVIVMQRAKDSNMQEIVLGKSKSDSTRKRGSNVTFEDVEPEKGETFYSDYIAQNLTIPEDIKMKNSRGEVQLSFDVNELGEPVNIKVEKSLCEDCDKEAVRLLKDGPKWSKKKNKKGKLKIRF